MKQVETGFSLGIVGDTLDDLMDVEADEEETDNIMNSIFEEIGLEIKTSVFFFLVESGLIFVSKTSVPTTKLPAPAEQDDAVEARLAALRAL